MRFSHEVPTMRFLLVVAALALLSAPLAACGKKGGLRAPGEDLYPRSYPDLGPDRTPGIDGMPYEK